MKIITSNEVAELLNSNKVIVIATNYVYDLTDFYKKHPGGSYLIYSKKGTDVTTYYNNHPEHAKKKWKNFLIGKINSSMCNIL